ncbi:hypothetical protein BH24ACT7_BH24ACT7_22920 [soil metagenome]
MAPGIPGLGIASVFYVAAALLAPLREVVRTARGDSSAARWKIVRRQFSLAIGIIVSLVLLYIGFDALIARGLSPPPVPFSVPGGYPTWVYAIVVLAAVLFSVTMSAAALSWHARTTRSNEDSGSIVDAYRATITLIERVPPTADGRARYLAVSPPHEEPRAGEDDIDIPDRRAGPPALSDAPATTEAPCPARTLVRRDADSTESTLPVPSGGLTDWSPDGTQILFGSGHDLNDESYVIYDGTDLRRLTDDGAADFLARWSPDGALIAFVSDRGAPNRMPLPAPDLWLLDPATGQTRPLTEGFGDVLGHSWSPQGERIIFTRASTEGSIFGDLWLVDVRIQEAELLAEGEYAWPEWSCDGEAIAYVTTRAGQPFVAYLDLASGDHIDVAPGDFPRCSPDGRSILLTRDESIIAVDVDDGTEEVVTNGCCASIAPDGPQLVINRDT